HSRVVSLWVKSALKLAIRACNLANLRDDCLRLLDKGSCVPLGNFAFLFNPIISLADAIFRLTARPCIFKRRNADLRGSGAAMLSPVERVAAALIPKSTPVIACAVRS